MLATAHLFMGAIIGKYFDSVPLIIALALLSHYVLDAVPHYNPKSLKNFIMRSFLSNPDHDKQEKKS